MPFENICPVLLSPSQQGRKGQIKMGVIFSCIQYIFFDFVFQPGFVAR